MRSLLLLLLASLLTCSSAFSFLPKRPITYADIAPQLHVLFEQQNLSPINFNDYIAMIAQRTLERETEGENDHLIYFILQSQRFTQEPRIEPALSAYEFVNSLKPEDKARYFGDRDSLTPSKELPRHAARRIDAFVRALEKHSGDERISYFKTWLRKNAGSDESSLRSYIYKEYARSMRFLYEKEFLSRHGDLQSLPPASLIASLYQNRGHSTDTQIEANYAVYVALAIIKSELKARQLNKVLIIGPGLDFAPRTDLIDVFNPQSYQPFAAADALLGLQLANRKELRIHSVDINDRVVDYLKSFPARSAKRLSILSGVGDTDSHRLTADYKEYFGKLGHGIGSPTPLEPKPENYKQHLGKSISVDDEVGNLITADKFNIITECYDPSPRYDLVIVTNVLQYFNDAELLLALSNIESMIGSGGYLIHNESRPLMSPSTKKLNLPMLHSRTVLIASSKNQPLYDRIYVHRK